MKGTNMADPKTNGPSNGGGRPRQDNTTMPGQYPAQIPFGFPVPQGTGAPGTAGTGVASDPTMQSPTPTSVFGSPADNMHTGSPGSSGAHASTSGGATYTEPFAHLAGGESGKMSGGSTDTEAQANKTGYPTPFGFKNPLNTGAGEGKPLIGGRGKG
jgi:hypothetical protein